jgi:transcriptional regulator with XRE-family HTH domain
MLSQIELGRSVPTISLLWKVAHALGVRFAALTNENGPNETTLLPAADARLLRSPDGRFTSRTLLPFDIAGRVEFYKITLDGGAEEISEPHPAGTIENLALATGKIELVVDELSYILESDDAISFEADVPHRYRNLRDERAVMYIVLVYPDSGS